jgi:hypothetical protein
MANDAKAGQQQPGPRRGRKRKADDAGLLEPIILCNELNAAEAEEEDGKHEKKKDDFVGGYLTCVICKDIATKPQLSACEHTFCLQCTDVWWAGDTKKPCPTCAVSLARENFRPLRDGSRIAWNLYCETVKVACAHRERGCTWADKPYADWAAHLQHNCPYRVVECAECGQSMTVAERGEHACPLRPVACRCCRKLFLPHELKEHQGGQAADGDVEMLNAEDDGGGATTCTARHACPNHCSATGQLDNVARHLETCPLQVVVCGLCDENVLRKELAAHDRQATTARHAPVAARELATRAALADLQLEKLARCKLSVRILDDTGKVSDAISQLVDRRWTAARLLMELPGVANNTKHRAVWLDHRRLQLSDDLCTATESSALLVACFPDVLAASESLMHIILFPTNSSNTSNKDARDAAGARSVHVPVTPACTFAFVQHLAALVLGNRVRIAKFTRNPADGLLPTTIRGRLRPT